MTRLVAVAAPELFAAALNRPWPDDLDGRVRCLDEGARALGLALSCAPWSPAAEDEALAAEMGVGSGLAPTVGQPDAMVAGLTGTPGALPVLGAVSGPAAWSARVEGDPDEVLDAASDLAAARVRALGACGVGRVAVVEADRPGFDLDRVVEAHEPILRTAEHLRLDIFLVVTSADTCNPARLGYERWASPGGCSEGLAFLPASVFESAAAVDRCLDERRAELAGAAEAVAAPLGPDADPAAVRAAAARLAELSGRAPASPDEPREEAR